MRIDDCGVEKFQLTRSCIVRVGGRKKVALQEVVLGKPSSCFNNSLPEFFGKFANAYISTLIGNTARYCVSSKSDINAFT
jgi:hypothetical protein